MKEWDDVLDKKALLSFKKTVDCDDVKVKEEIKKAILDNRFIIHVLNNNELDESEPYDYFGINIKPYYIIPDAQVDTKNYICYEVSYRDTSPYGQRKLYNPLEKVLQIIFYITCHEEDIIDKETEIARHDLLAALIQDQFNFSTAVGGHKMQLVSDMPGTTDNRYASRTLIFEQIADNNLVKTNKSGTSKLANKQIPNYGIVGEDIEEGNV